MNKNVCGCYNPQKGVNIFRIYKPQVSNHCHLLQPHQNKGHKFNKCDTKKDKNPFLEHVILKSEFYRL